MGNCVSKGQDGEKEEQPEKGHHTKGQGLMIRSALKEKREVGDPRELSDR